MAKPKIGNKAPAFKLESTAGEWSLGAQAGSAVVLYFYPKDNTPGCTDEGRQFAALHKAFRKSGCVIAGVSADSLKAHQNFKAKFAFPFELLSDPERKVCTLYDVIQEKTLYGRKYMGIERSTFLIDAKGVLRAEWRKVKVAGHAQAVLEALQAL